MLKPFNCFPLKLLLYVQPFTSFRLITFGLLCVWTCVHICVVGGVDRERAVWMCVCVEVVRGCVDVGQTITSQQLNI